MLPVYQSIILGGLFNTILSSWKTVTIALAGGAMASLFTFFIPTYIPVIACMCFILIDMFYGIKVSKKLKELQSNDKKVHAFISSSKWRNTPKKFIEAFMFIALAHLFDEAIVPMVSLHAVEFAAGIIATGEAISIVENLKALDPNHPWVRLFGGFVTSKAEKYLDITIEKQDLDKVKELCRIVK